MKTLIVIANYKVAHLTIECLRSLAPEVEKVPGLHVAICENGTGDDSADRIQTAITENGWGDWCSLLAVPTNLGFTGGNNVIIRPALESENPPDYFLLLNADTIVRPDGIKNLVDFMEKHPAAGIAGSRLEDFDGTPQCSFFRFHTPLSEFERTAKTGPITKLLRRWMVAPPVPDHECESEWVSGACVIIRRKVFNDVGLLDEGYFTYYEDTDLCLSARRAGWSIWYVPASRIVHFGGQSTGISHNSTNRQPAFSFQARRRYFLKNYGAGYAALADAGLLLGLVVWRLRVLFGKPDRDPPFTFSDSIAHSVFLTGFTLRDVKNPSAKDA